MIIVIPTNRSINFSYLRPLIDEGVRFIIVDDSQGSVFIDHPQFQVYNWEDRKHYLGQLDEYFPRYNGACRDFGFYIAWLESESDEIIIAVDDDCAIEDVRFAEMVVNNLNCRKRAVFHGEGIHMNILDLYDNTSTDIFPRGFPYSARYGYKKWEQVDYIETDAVFNLGLWKGVFDINGIDKINGPDWKYDDACLKYESTLIPPGALVSVCSMNMQFRRTVLPAVFQLPMHVSVMPGWCVDRYGDIWGGFILKKLIDIRNDHMTVGMPMIHHKKESKYITNIYQEHICHLINDEFIEFLSVSAENVASSDYLTMMSDLHENMVEYSTNCSKILSEYVKHMLRSMGAWIKALEP